MKKLGNNLEKSLVAALDMQTKRFYEFGSFRLDLAQRILLREGQHIPLTLKAYETLLVLVNNSGRIVEKEELLNQVWPDAFIEEATLAKNISTLRKVLDKGDSTQEYIETIPKRGYRFVAAVREVQSSSAEDLAPPRLVTDAALAVAQLPNGVHHRKRTIIVITLGLLVGVAALGGLTLRRRPHMPTPKISPFTTLPGRESDMTFSPDGNQLVFTWDGSGKKASCIFTSSKLATKQYDN